MLSGKGSRRLLLLPSRIINNGRTSTPSQNQNVYYDEHNNGLVFSRASDNLPFEARRWKSGGKSNLHYRAARALSKKLDKDGGTKNNHNNHNNSNNNAGKETQDLDSKKASVEQAYHEVNDELNVETIDNDADIDSVLSDLQNPSSSSNDTNNQDTLSLSEPSSVHPPAQLHRVISPYQGNLNEFAPRIVVVGVGGAGGNALNNMVASHLNGVDFLALNTDAQHLSTTLTDNRLQIGTNLTLGLGCGANPDAGRLAAEESREEITELLSDAHLVFITAGMGGGTGTGAAPVVAEICYNLGILTIGVVSKPFNFEGRHRMRLANEGINRLKQVVDTLIIIPNQNLFHLADIETTFADSFAMSNDVLLAGVKSITDLMTTPGMINLDFADVQSVMHRMGNAILGTGQASHLDKSESDEEDYDRAIEAAKQALSNPLLGHDMDIGTAKGMLVNITGGKDMTLMEVDRAAQCITERIQDENANIIFGSAYDENLNGSIRVSVVATGLDE
mmetsp:Transcript_2806/g.3974  ORF Transcript_2806/g.3974 Transcript_2806/m.3974 type:complete len:505 (+) Transcript_2806:200-1714(+)|eukprot:CAMPEP_0184859834 /NCGR_PEP_ID=MMETSP0580-20130426/4808_1 /TAXON_ID=1118495 /ORGANISM="Dactyliosolen fragilissimus" /LENGTH=504 /DNA_ID=CAMNT_0027356679 /DNA_START=126 /DNA_END=1640 /DNA_ORIENTATION=-